MYHPDEIIKPYEISKNAYKLKGHSGILDTKRVMLVGPAGNFPVAYPGGALRFERMIDEHTATYEVLVGGNNVDQKAKSL
jgi:hypothetical protein